MIWVTEDCFSVWLTVLIFFCEALSGLNLRDSLDCFSSFCSLVGSGTCWYNSSTSFTLCFILLSFFSFDVAIHNAFSIESFCSFMMQGSSWGYMESTFIQFMALIQKYFLSPYILKRAKHTHTHTHTHTSCSVVLPLSVVLLLCFCKIFFFPPKCNRNV